MFRLNKKLRRMLEASFDTFNRSESPTRIVAHARFSQDEQRSRSRKIENISEFSTARSDAFFESYDKATKG